MVVEKKLQNIYTIYIHYNALKAKQIQNHGKCLGTIVSASHSEQISTINKGRIQNEILHITKCL